MSGPFELAGWLPTSVLRARARRLSMTGPFHRGAQRATRLCPNGEVDATTGCCPFAAPWARGVRRASAFSRAPSRSWPSSLSPCTRARTPSGGCCGESAITDVDGLAAEQLAGCRSRRLCPPVRRCGSGRSVSGRRTTVRRSRRPSARSFRRTRFACTCRLPCLSSGRPRGCSLAPWLAAGSSWSCHRRRRGRALLAGRSSIYRRHTGWARQRHVRLTDGFAGNERDESVSRRPTGTRRAMVLLTIW
jgi:hypothetical protein